MLTDALTEDPTVFDYDNVYDDMQEKKRISNMKLQAKKDTKVCIFKAHNIICITIVISFTFKINVYIYTFKDCTAWLSCICICVSGTFIFFSVNL